VSYLDLVNYLMFSKLFYMMEDMKAWRSLKAYYWLTSGWVRDVTQ